MSSQISISSFSSLKVINSKRFEYHKIISKLIRKRKIIGITIIKMWNLKSIFNENCIVHKDFILNKTYKSKIKHNWTFSVHFDILFEISSLLHLMISSNTTIVKLRTVWINNYQVKTVLILVNNKLRYIVLSISIPYHDCYGYTIIVYSIY